MTTSPKLHHDDLAYTKGDGDQQTDFVAVQPWRSASAFSKGDHLPQFLVGTENGFLPRQEPLVELPPRFAKLEDLLRRMTIRQPDGSAGLLASGEFGQAVDQDLPLYDVDDIDDPSLLAALYRDYTFAASAYLLEPCDLLWRQKRQYGLGREHLPKQIAIPLCKVADKIGAKPFMEYALSYALYNWQRIDPTRPIDFDNLRVIRAFAGSKSEAGFILVHVAMVRYSGDLVRATLAVLDAPDRPSFDRALQSVFATLTNINGVMESMWTRSSPTGYEHFRTFIMGTKNQPMFPRGVVYDGVSREPQFYRGESGANDSMIPTMDNLLQLTEHLPENPLTRILRDFRSYRPADHSAFVEWVQNRANQFQVRAFAQQDPTSTVWYLKCVDMVRNFRVRHWNFTKEYILKHSDHPVATGGSPIVTWLPNQLRAVLQIMNDCASQVQSDQVQGDLRKDLVEIRARVAEQLSALDEEVAILRARFPDQDRLAVA